MQTHLTKSSPASQAFILCGLGGVGLVGVEVLVGLGLTRRQARVYLSLLKACNSKIQTIAGPSLVHRQEIYRVLDSLMQMGLVQRNVSVPITYTPTPIEEAIKMLLQQKTSQLETVATQAKLLSERLRPFGTSQAAVDLRPCFGVVFEGDRGRKFHKTILNSNVVIDAVTSWKRFRQLSIHFDGQLQNLLKQGLAIRIETEKPANLHLPKWVNTAAANYPNFKIKTTPNLPATGVTIFDAAQVAIAFNPNVSLTKGPELWSTNPSMVSLCQTYFNAMWAQTNNS